MEPIEVTKTMDTATNDTIYRNSEESSTVLTLECNSLKSDAATLAHENSVKLESIVTNSSQSVNRVPSADANMSIAAANVNTAPATSTNWTPLTPPQTTLQ